MPSSKKAFVLMPFRRPYDSYYPAIFEPALAAAGYKASRADDVFTPRPVMLDIQDAIASASLILCEMNERNPNVFYELGLAHAIGKPAILISRDQGDIPFDLRHIRVILYDTAYAGWEQKLKTAITNAALSVTASADVWPPPMIRKDANSVLASTSSDKKTLNSPAVERPFNLGFDGPTQDEVPAGWFNSFGHVALVSTEYIIRVIRRSENRSAGTCAVLEKTNALPGEFGSLMQRCSGRFLAGRTVRFEGELRTKDVSEWAGLWFRADGSTKADLFFDNMSRRPVTGTTPWSRYFVDAQLPTETAWINYGVVLAGSGFVAADNLRILVWEADGRWVEV